jgi:excisionase family DNA binding protein
MYGEDRLTVIEGKDIDMDEQIMSFKEAMSFLKIPRSTLYKLVQEGKVPAIKVGRHWRFSKATLERWIAGEGIEISGQTEGFSSPRERKYCWQSDRKTQTDHQCTKCLTHRVRALNCFLLRNEVGSDMVQCDKECKECDYFKQHFN